VDLDGFPEQRLAAAETLYRIHRAVRGPWYFSGDGSGRFDPGAGVGACYLSPDPLGAWVESFRTPTLIEQDAVADRALFTVEPGRELRLADVRAREALSFGVTASLSSGEDYRPSQAFASQATQAGFDGILYLVRHDPAAELRGVALFGPEGPAAEGDGRWPAGQDLPIPAELIAAAGAQFGYVVLPRP